MAGWFCFFTIVPVAFSRACGAVWDPSGAIALLPWGVSAKGASGYGVKPTSWREWYCFQDTRCAVRTVPCTVTGVSGDSFILVTCKYRPLFKSGKRLGCRYWKRSADVFQSSLLPCGRNHSTFLTRLSCGVIRILASLYTQVAEVYHTFVASDSFSSLLITFCILLSLLLWPSAHPFVLFCLRFTTHGVSSRSLHV